MRSHHAMIWLTADRAARKMQLALKRKIAALPEGSDRRAALELKLKKIDSGGRIILAKGVKISGTRGVHAAHLKKEILQLDPGMSRNPNHWSNRTRNIEFQNGEKRKMHISLMMEFDNEEVIY